MLETLNSTTIFWLSLAGLITGISKFSTGGMGIIILPVAMMAIPDKSVLGVIVLMYIITDMMAVLTYRDSINWNLLKKILPTALAGILVGIFIVDAVNNKIFLLILFILTIFMLTVSLMLDKYKVDLSRYPILAYSVGGISGFISMVGNAGGPILNLFLLAVGGNDKACYIGTRAWMFTLMNFSKGIGLIVIGLLTWETAKLSLVTLPGVFLGSLFGYLVLKRINMVFLKMLIRLLIAISACRLLYAHLTG